MDEGEQAAFRRALRQVLRGLREARGLSLEDAASAAGVSVTRLRSVEAGKRDPWFTEVIALARLYGVAPDTDLLLDLTRGAMESGPARPGDQTPTAGQNTAGRDTD